MDSDLFMWLLTGAAVFMCACSLFAGWYGKGDFRWWRQDQLDRENRGDDKSMLDDDTHHRDDW